MRPPIRFLHLCAWLGIALGGCAPEPRRMNYFSEPNLPITGRIDRAPPDTTIQTLGSDVLVFGRLRWIDNGEERTDYRSAWGWNVWLKFVQIEHLDFGVFVVEKDGQFTWRIPPGSYLLNRAGWRDPVNGLHWFLPLLRFDARRGEADALCLGTLVIDPHSRKDALGGRYSGGIGIRVDDDCDRLAERFRSRYPGSEWRVGKSLLVFDPQLRESDL